MSPQALILLSGLTNSGPPRARHLRNQRVQHSNTTILTTLLTQPRITRTTGNIVLASGGVVRGITNWGTFLLPYPARKQGATYNAGHYFILRFDSSGQTQHAVRRTLGLDPRMIRYSVVKMGEKFEEISKVGGKAQWPAFTQQA